MIRDVAAPDQIILNQLTEMAFVSQQVIEQQVNEIERMSVMIMETFNKGGRLLLFGNGGSAADAQHIAAEFVNKFRRERNALPAIALTTDTSLITAISNDRGFDTIFARQIQALVKENDLVVGISTSGNSLNVINGLRVAEEAGAQTIGFTGRDGGLLKSTAHMCYHAPSDSTPRIQEVHILVWHAICEVVERSYINPKPWAVFLDRDGTVNEEVNYLDDPADIRLYPDVSGAIRLLNEQDIPVILITNQSGISRGYFSEDDLSIIHQALKEKLAARGAFIDAIYTCPHHPDNGCDCRKPKTGMLLEAAGEFGFDLDRSFLIGDKECDLLAGIRAGCQVSLVKTGYGEATLSNLKHQDIKPDYVGSNLLDSVLWIINSAGKHG